MNTLQKPKKIKVTALMPDNLIIAAKHYTHQTTTTDSLIVALQEWVAIKKIAEVRDRIRKKPLVFQAGFNKELVRKLRIS